MSLFKNILWGAAGAAVYKIATEGNDSKGGSQTPSEAPPDVEAQFEEHVNDSLKSYAWGNNRSGFDHWLRQAGITSKDKAKGDALWKIYRKRYGKY